MSTLPLSPLTDDALYAEHEDAWADLAAWAKTGANYGFDDHIVGKIKEANERHNYARDALKARR